MEELMKTKIFKVTVERLLLNGGQTLYMVGWSLLIGTIIGMILALILVLCRKGGLVENRPLYMIVSVYINVVRSIPFVILLVTIMPITRAIVGTTIGSTAALVPLVVYISPYLARLMENSLLEIDPGILEAAEAMGINLARHKRLAFCISSFFAGVGGGLFAMFANQAQAKVFTTAMTYEILLIVVIGGIGSISGSCIAAFLYVAASEWWLRFLDAETYIGSFKVPFLRTGFRMVVFSVIIMVVVLFFRKGIMGDKELPDLLKKRQKRAKKEAVQP